MPSCKELKSFLTKTFEKAASKTEQQKNTSVQRHQPVKRNTLPEEERIPYFFQIGFDFGTSSSKVVIRDINIDKAWVFPHSDVNDLSSILIPSVVLFDTDSFSIHDNIEILYPTNGLFHLKVALEKIALNKLDDNIFEEYRKIIKFNSKYSPVEITEMATTFLLSVWLKKIVAYIRSKFPDYGSMKGDQIRVNMAIPVESMSNVKVRDLFRSVLSTAWKLSSESIIDTSVKIDEFYEIYRRYRASAAIDSCQVYPEVSANAQAFFRSPATSPDERTLYIFTDVGAGTVDQCVFTYAGPDQKDFNYFAAKVYPYGSRFIEFYACQSKHSTQNLEYWRKKKETCINETIKIAMSHVYYDIQGYITTTLNQTKKTYIIKHNQDIKKILQENVTFIFSGGGCNLTYPYIESIIDSYKKYIGNNKDPIITSIPYPDDLELPCDCKDYITRLFVSYGLSFLYIELPDYNLLEDNVYKNENIKSSSDSTYTPCSCGGRNKNCTKCFGTGKID